MSAPKGTEVRPGLYRGPDTPRDKEGHHYERDADRKFRPYLVAKHKRLEAKCSGKRHRTIDQLRQINGSRETF